MKSDLAPEAIASASFLDDNAREVFDSAPQSCDPAIGCLRYHRLWPLARLASDVTQQLAGTSFFHKELATLPSRKPHILIAGAADTGLLATIATIANKLSLEASYTLVDRCQTVINQNRRFSELAGINVEFIHSDLLHCSADKAQVIIGHSIMSFFDNQGRNELLTCLGNLLNPGGTLLLTNTAYKQEQVASSIPPFQFDAESLEHRASELGFTALQMTQLRECLHDSGARRLVKAQRPIEHELLEQIEKAGFKTRTINRYPVDVQHRGPVSPPTSDNAVRLELRSIYQYGEDVARCQAQPTYSID